MTDIFGSSGNTISSLYDDDIDFNYDGVDSGIDVTQITNAFLRRDGGNTATGDLNLDSHKIINLSEPTSNTDAATKAYVDSKSSVSGAYLPLTGGTMSENIDMNNKQLNNVLDPSSDQQVATKKYVDIEPKQHTTFLNQI